MKERIRLIHKFYQVFPFDDEDLLEANKSHNMWQSHSMWHHYCVNKQRTVIYVALFVCCAPCFSLYI